MDVIKGFRDTTDRMVYGHEAWLEMGASHAHTGEDTAIYVKWGHHMKVDGLARREGMDAQVVLPGGEIEGITITEGSPEYHLVKFTPRIEGLYHVVTKHEGHYAVDSQGKYHRGTRQEYPDAVKATYYLQFAQIIVPAGHDLEAAPPMRVL